MAPSDRNSDHWNVKRENEQLAEPIDYAENQQNDNSQPEEIHELSLERTNHQQLFRNVELQTTIINNRERLFLPMINNVINDENMHRERVFVQPQLMPRLERRTFFALQNVDQNGMDLEIRPAPGFQERSGGYWRPEDADYITEIQAVEQCSKVPRRAPLPKAIFTSSTPQPNRTRYECMYAERTRLRILPPGPEYPGSPQRIAYLQNELDSMMNSRVRERFVGKPMRLRGGGGKSRVPEPVPPTMDEMLSKMLAGGFSEGAGFSLPQGLVPTRTTTGGSFRPEQVPPPDYCANVTTPPGCVRDLRLQIPNTGEVTITDDVGECERHKCPTWVNLDVKFKDGSYQVNIERLPDAECVETARVAKVRADLLGEELPDDCPVNKKEQSWKPALDPIKIHKQLFGGATLDTETFEKVRTMWYSDDPKKNFTCCECADTLDGEEESGPGGDTKYQELQASYLQVPAPLVPLHHIMENIEGLESTGWSHEHIEALTAKRLRSLTTLRRNLCKYIYEMKNCMRKVKELSQSNADKMFYAAKVASKLAILIDLIYTWRKFNAQRIDLKVLVAGKLPRSSVAGNTTGFCISRRAYTKAETGHQVKQTRSCGDDENEAVSESDAFP